VGRMDPMQEIRTRPMSSTEFEGFRVGLVRDYAAEHVAAGNWTAEEAEGRASDDADALLPEGVDTPGVLLLVAETPGGEVVGHLWVSLERHVGRRDGAWIYDIEIVPEHRGQGFGRALLTAAEHEVATRGIGSIGLNVFSANSVARRLYESAGYDITTMQLKKGLSSGGGTIHSH